MLFAAHDFTALVTSVNADTIASLRLFTPELAVVGTILLLLFLRLFSLDRWVPGSLVAMAGAVVALGLASYLYLDFGSATEGSRPIFTGLLTYDLFTAFFRIFLLLFLLFVVYLTMVSGIPDREDSPDFYVLLFGSTLGMMLMASANHLLMVFLAVEMTSVPSYAMVGFLKGRKQSSEAALKYVVYGAGAAGVMLYGISLLAGLLGTASLPAMVVALGQFSESHTNVAFDPAVRTLVLALLMIVVGVAFKLSLFPFHFWCPDAFEGAAAEVGAFLSVASKGAAFGLLVRLLLAVTQWEDAARLGPLMMYFGIGLGVLGAASATYGNLTAYTQTNIKRLLAYSTIAQSGYMMMAVAAMMVILNAPDSTETVLRHAQGQRAVSALLYYLSVYFFMNLGAFAIAAMIRNQVFSEEIKDMAGLIRTSPTLAICMLVCMFSLVGLPPLGGFFGKFMIFASLTEAASHHPAMWAILVIACLNTVFSLVYYARVVKTMFFESPAPDSALADVTLNSDGGRYAVLACLPVLLLGIIVEPISKVTLDVARQLF